MAISVPSKPVQYTSFTATPIVKQKPYDWGAKLRNSFASMVFTTAGFTTAALLDIFLIKLPPGKVRLFVDQCRLVCPAGTATSDLDVGWAAYTDQANVVVAKIERHQLTQIR